MDLKEIYRKMKFHISEVAIFKSPKFVFYRLLVIISRRVPIPGAVFTYTVTGYHGEKHLEKFMCPLKGGCFIDVGANVGYWTMFVAKRGFNIHAFEPSPRPYQILKHRVRKYKNVRTYPIALGDTSGFINMRLMKSFSKHSIMGVISDLSQSVEKDDVIGEISVPIKKLDNYGFENVSVIKIDTEGYEIPILKGAENTIIKYKPRLIVEVHFPPFKDEVKRIIKILEGWGYSYRLVNKKGIGGINPQPHIIANHFRCGV